MSAAMDLLNGFKRAEADKRRLLDVALAQARQTDVLFLSHDSPRRLQARCLAALPHKNWPKRLTFVVGCPETRRGALDAIRTWAADVESPGLVVVDPKVSRRSENALFTHK